jgi:putative restriction endonuclease
MTLSFRRIEHCGSPWRLSFRWPASSVSARRCTDLGERTAPEKHAELLDAAHIVGDSEAGGDPVVPNGMALGKIHHVAFDRNFLGMSPTLEVHIHQRLHDEVDGLMRGHGLQEVHGVTASVWRYRSAKPDPDRLHQRFEAFLQAS